MHWCAYPSPTHCLIQAKKQNKSANTMKQHEQTQQLTAQSLTTYCENSRRDWQNIKMSTRKKGSKSAFIVPSPKCKRFTDTEAQMDINGR